jgi:hypothetical protein
MPGLLFLSQAVIDAWAERGNVEFEDGHLFVVAMKGCRLSTDPAVRFIKVIPPGVDRQGLVGKVKTNAHLRTLGAECVGDSVLLDDIAYEVQTGYLASEGASLEGDGAKTERAAPTPAAAADEQAAGAEALARFLIEKLS